MFDIIDGIIDHNWVTNDSSQQYVYYICSVVIPILVVIVSDAVRSVFRAFLGRRK